MANKLTGNKNTVCFVFNLLSINVTK